MLLSASDSNFWRSTTRPPSPTSSSSSKSAHVPPATWTANPRLLSRDATHRRLRLHRHDAHRLASREGDVYSGLDEQVAHFAELPGPAIVVFQDVDEPPSAPRSAKSCAPVTAVSALWALSPAARRATSTRSAAWGSPPSATASSVPTPPATSLRAPAGACWRHGNPPGDLLHADANGVCSIPGSIASEVAHAAAEFMACESVCIDFAVAGNRDVKGTPRRARKCSTASPNWASACGLRERDARGSVGIAFARHGGTDVGYRLRSSDFFTAVRP